MNTSSLTFAFLFLFVCLFSLSSSFVQAQSSNTDNRNSDIFTPAVVLSSSGIPGTAPPGTIYDYRWFAFQTCPFFFNTAANTFFGAPNPFGTFGNPLFLTLQSSNTVVDVDQLLRGNANIQFNLPNQIGQQTIFNFKSAILTNAPVATGPVAPLPTNNICPVASRDGVTSFFVIGPQPQNYIVQANIFEDAVVFAQSASTGSTVLTPIGPASTRQARIFEVLFDAATVSGPISPFPPTGFVSINPSQTVTFAQITKLCINIVAFLCVPDTAGIALPGDIQSETVRQCSNAFAQVTGSNVGFNAEQCPAGTLNPSTPFTAPF